MKPFSYYLYNKLLGRDVIKREEQQGHRKLSGYTLEKSPRRTNTTYREMLQWGTALVILAIIGSLLLVALALAHSDTASVVPTETAGEDTVVACYYNTVEEDTGGLQPTHVPPHLCTHLLVAFARVHACTVQLERGQERALRDLVRLKLNNPSLKIMLSIGGAGENDGFPDMVKDHASRKMFIKSIKNVLRNYTLDGIDLDWEFPVLHYNRDISQKTRVYSSNKYSLFSRERQHFSQLLREIRLEFIREKRNYILSVALAAPETVVDVAYDVDQVNNYVDFANIMTYDFHSYTNFTPFTGFNSPLYARSSEGLFLATLNINYTIQMYQTKGLQRNKIVVGIPTYGHTFTLVNEENPGVGSPASGFGTLGSRGFADYAPLCAFAARRDVARRWDEEASVPYLYRGVEWASYDEPSSVRAKADFIRAHGLRGAMIYSLNADDYGGACGPPFPLTGAVAHALRARALGEPRLYIGR